MKNTKGKHLKNKRRRIIFKDRFYSLITLLLGLISIPVIAKINDGDITISIFFIIISFIIYIESFRGK